MSPKIPASDASVIIAGCGSIGASLAIKFWETGYDVKIIDSDAAAFKKLGPEFTGLPVEGDAGNVETLLACGIQQAHFVIAATGHDNLNIMIAQIAKDVYSAPCVIACLSESSNQTVLDEMGIQYFFPTQMVSDAVCKLLNMEDIRNL